MIQATLLGVAAICPVRAASIDNLQVTLKDDRYHLVAETRLHAPATAIYKVLVDYADNRFARISDVFKESGYLAPDSDGAALVFTRVEGCVMFFCRSMRRVERLDVEPPRFIRTTTIPERSDFRYSLSQWELEPDGQSTRVTYRLDMEPDFWLPPFIGPWYLKRFLSRDGTAALERIEQLALDENDSQL